MNSKLQPEPYSGEILILADLHKVIQENETLRHPGLTVYTAGSYCEAARVCLRRHHEPPSNISIKVNDTLYSDKLEWEIPNQQALNSQAADKDATCNGAYAISLLCVERKMNLVAVCRASEGSGADWMLAPPGEGVDELGEPDLESPRIVRLEVSGQDKGALEARVNRKKKQLGTGNLDIPGFVSIVGFEKPVVIIMPEK